MEQEGKILRNIEIVTCPTNGQEKKVKRGKIVRNIVIVICVVFMGLFTWFNYTYIVQFPNRFSKEFRFEKYKTAAEAEKALLKLHPIGSDVDALVKTLERAGAEVEIRNYTYHIQIADLSDRLNKSGEVVEIKDYNYGEDIVRKEAKIRASVYARYYQREFNPFLMMDWQIMITGKEKKLLFVKITCYETH